MGGVQTLVFPCHSPLSNINDSYCANPTSLSVNLVRLVSKDKVVKDSAISELIDSKVGCVLSCCKSCSYCSFTRTSTKERSKSRSLFEQNKACQRCFFCKSMLFCTNCSQCPQCCRRTECRGMTPKVLAYLAGNGCESSGSFCSKGRVYSAFQTETPSKAGF